jgi:hypothetical protein
MKRIKEVSTPDGLSDKDYKSQVTFHLGKCKRITKSAWRCAEAGVLPTINIKNEFGLFEQIHVLALKWAIENRKILPIQLEDAARNSKALQSLIVTTDNPHRAKFQSIYDMMEKFTD